MFCFVSVRPNIKNGVYWTLSVLGHAVFLVVIRPRGLEKHFPYCMPVNTVFGGQRYGEGVQERRLLPYIIMHIIYHKYGRDLDTFNVLCSEFLPPFICCLSAPFLNLRHYNNTSCFILSFSFLLLYFSLLSWMKKILCVHGTCWTSFTFVQKFRPRLLCISWTLSPFLSSHF